MRQKKIKIAFDLDGVIIDKPPFIPKSLLEWLFRGGTGDIFSCRYPTCKVDQLLRKISHFYLFRPPIKKNITFLKKLSKNKQFEFFVISSRYSFLTNETKNWFQKREIDGLFKKIYLNTNDLKPYLFKEKILKELKPDIFIDDDKEIISYLKEKIPHVRFYYFDGRSSLSMEKLLNLNK